MNICSVFASKVTGTREIQRNCKLVFGSHVVSPGHRLDTGSDLGSASKPVAGTIKRLKFNRPKNANYSSKFTQTYMVDATYTSVGVNVSRKFVSNMQNTK